MMNLEPVHCETHDFMLAPRTCKSLVISANHNRRAIKVFLLKNSGNPVPTVYMRFERAFPEVYELPAHDDACMVMSLLWSDVIRVIFEDEDKLNKKCYRGAVCFGLYNTSLSDTASCNISYYEY